MSFAIEMAPWCDTMKAAMYSVSAVEVEMINCVLLDQEKGNPLRR